MLFFRAPIRGPILFAPLRASYSPLLCCILPSYIYHSYLSTCAFDQLKIAAARVLCAHRRRLAYALQQVLADGGEGVVLRKPASQYEHGRSTNLIKLKVSFFFFQTFIILFTPYVFSFSF